MKTLCPSKFMCMVWFALLLTLIIGGCGLSQSEWDAYQVQLDELNERVQVASGDLDAALAHRAEVNAALSTTQLRLQEMSSDPTVTPEEIAEWQRRLSGYEASIGEVTFTVTSLQSTLGTLTTTADELNEIIQNAGSAEEALGAGASALGTVLAPFSGPYAPLVLLGTNLLNTFLTSKRQRRQITHKIAAPIEMARNKVLEAKLRADSSAGFVGKEWLVVDKDKLGSLHSDHGVSSDVRFVTEKISPTVPVTA